VLALWAEQDVITADEFRDGNITAGSGNRRVVETASRRATGPLGRRLMGGRALTHQRGQDVILKAYRP
jgi:hypothetical protein